MTEFSRKCMTLNMWTQQGKTLLHKWEFHFDKFYKKECSITSHFHYICRFNISPCLVHNHSPSTEWSFNLFGNWDYIFSEQNQLIYSCKMLKQFLCKNFLPNPFSVKTSFDSHKNCNILHYAEFQLQACSSGPVRYRFLNNSILK